MIDTTSEEPQELILPLGMIDIGHPAFALSGRVADAWSTFEFHVDRTIWKLATVGDGAGACITAQIFSVHSRWRALMALVEHAGGSDRLLKDLGSIAGRSEQLGEERNRIVHDPWMMNVTKHTSGKLRITAKKKLHFAYVAVPLAEIESSLDRIKTHLARFLKFEEALWAEIPTWPDMPPSPSSETTPDPLPW
jgi:hypothetical protein